MSRWHNPSCVVPDVALGQDDIVCCHSCGASASLLLEELQKASSSSPLYIPEDESYGALGLRWPPTVNYTNQSLKVSGTAPSTNPQPQDHGSVPHQAEHIKEKPGTYQDILKSDEFRLLCLSAPEVEGSRQLLHATLEVFTHENRPEYETVSYTWGGEDGDDAR